MIIGTGIVISSTVLGCTILVAAIVVAMITKYELTHDAEQDFFDTKKEKGQLFKCCYNGSNLFKSILWHLKKIGLMCIKEKNESSTTQNKNNVVAGRKPQYWLIHLISCIVLMEGESGIGINVFLSNVYKC